MVTLESDYLDLNSGSTSQLLSVVMSKILDPASPFPTV